MKTELATSLRRIVRGTDDTRVRATWRICIAILVTFSGAAIGAVVLRRIALTELLQPLVGHTFAVGGVLTALFVLARYVDHRPIPAYGFTKSYAWIIDVLGGTLTGIALVCLAFIGSYERGEVTIVEIFSPGAAQSFAVGMSILVLGWILVAVWEETLFRSLFFKNATEGLAARGLSKPVAILGAWVASSLVYGFLHGPFGSNPESIGLVYALIMTSVMGGLFGLAYALSDELAFPIGLHTGINFAEHNLFFGPIDAVVPAVLRVRHTISGESIQFQSIDPLVIIPVFLCGYVFVAVWFYLRNGTISLGFATQTSDSGLSR